MPKIEDAWPSPGEFKMLRREALQAVRPSPHSVNLLEYTDGRLLVT